MRNMDFGSGFQISDRTDRASQSNEFRKSTSGWIEFKIVKP